MDRERFKQKWLPYSERFYRVAYYILEDRDEAEDAVQDLYIRLWNRRNEDVANPFAYGAAALKNICYDRIRRKSPEPLEDTAADRIPGNLTGPEDSVTGRDTLSKLERLMEKLPEKQRTVLRMRVYKEMSYEDISQETGLSEINLRVLLSTARKTLKKELEALK